MGTAKKHAKKRRKVIPQGTPLPTGETTPVKPKNGPGQVFRSELVGMQTGLAKRFRNVAVTPLTLAYFRGHLALAFDAQHPVENVTPDERYAAGLEIEKLWSQLHTSNLRDSTTPGVTSGFSNLFLTESKEQAGRRLRMISERMSQRDWAIVIKFCGEQWSAPDALRFAGVVFDRRVVWYRICEALDDLQYTITGRTPPAARASWPTAATSSVPLRERDTNVA